MKIQKTAVLLTIAAMSAGTVFGAGFGIYEASARGNAMGGGLIGSTGDASANYYNPANLTEVTNISVIAGVSLINPFCDVHVSGQRQNKMNPGWFPPPHFYISAPITEDLFVGFGSYCEFGLGTKYGDDWALKYDTTETTIEQFTFNPNIAYKITEDWSIAVGARMSYITFENYKTPLDGYASSINPAFAPLDSVLGRQFIRTHLKGDDFACGYVLATQYKVTDELRLGAVYRSRLNHKLKGDFETSGSVHPQVTGATGGKVAVPPSGDASAKLDLPSSVVLGANYDFTDNFRGGVAVTWTEWSSVHHIDFCLPPPSSRRQTLNWHDVWRFGVGFEYDFTDSIFGRMGYTYDMDPSSDAYGTTMLPPGDRHIVGFGIGYEIFENLRLDLGYNFIIMESSDRMIHDETGLRPTQKFSCDNSYSHIASFSISYSF